MASASFIFLLPDLDGHVIACQSITTWMRREVEVAPGRDNLISSYLLPSVLCLWNVNSAKSTFRLAFVGLQK